MIKPIYLFGSGVLREAAADIDINDREAVASLVTDLKDTLAKADGCGLAAPQIGVPLRVLIVTGDGLEDAYPYLKGFKRTMINPVVVEESKEKCTFSEGCLSVPGVYADVTRPAAITIRYYDEELKQVEERLDKFACRMVQHEMDHLNGIIFVDKVAPIRKKMIAKKLQNISRGKVSTSYKTK